MGVTAKQTAAGTAARLLPELRKTVTGRMKYIIIESASPWREAHHAKHGQEGALRKTESRNRMKEEN